jgi:glycosyltransferase involved in cell wall biosynthesis
MHVSKIGIVGTVGVPSRYGGFETLAEQLARRIKPSQAVLIVYCQRSAYPEVLSLSDRCFASHRRVFVPFKANGPASMFHDALAMIHAALFVRVDVMLVLGYSGGWALPLVKLLRPKMRIVTNIDGMEWRRNKFDSLAKKVLRFLEWTAVRFSHFVIADNQGIAQIARDIYAIDPVLIAYGGDHTIPEYENKSRLNCGSYYLSIARIEPENNCHVILAACEATGSPLIFVGNWDASEYGRRLKRLYSRSQTVKLLDPIYDQSELLPLRKQSIGYIHGHSVGGTNPSLVEALFHNDRVLAFDCPFNRFTLMNNGAYFCNIDSLTQLLSQGGAGKIKQRDLLVLRDNYCWDNVVKSYLQVLVNKNKV